MTWHRPNSSAGRITSPFGQRTPPYPGASAYHLGVDLRAGVYGVDGSIYAAQGGTVSSRYVTPMGANVVVIDHSGGIKTYYVHMPDDGIYVRRGDRVIGGQRIAVAGMTGAATVHLHFETRVNGVALDPVPFMRERGIDLTVTTVSNTNPGGGSVVVPTLPGAPAPLTPEDDMPLDGNDKQWIHDAVVGILRAPEFALGVADRRQQTAEAVLGGTVTDDRTYGTQALSLVLGDIFANARAAASMPDQVDVDALADALVIRLPKADGEALLNALAARLES